jgi:hypothetical protein
MAASLLDRIPVDEISVEARQIHFGRAVLTLIAAVLFGAGWLAAKTVTGLWLAATWSVAALRVGWREGRRGAVSRGAA